MGKKGQRGIEIMGYSKMSSGNGEGVKNWSYLPVKKGVDKELKVVVTYR